jgi:hypothetical protein
MFVPTRNPAQRLAPPKPGARYIRNSCSKTADSLHFIYKLADSYEFFALRAPGAIRLLTDCFPMLAS